MGMMRHRAATMRGCHRECLGGASAAGDGVEAGTGPALTRWHPPCRRTFRRSNQGPRTGAQVGTVAFKRFSLAGEPAHGMLIDSLADTGGAERPAAAARGHRDRCGVGCLNSCLLLGQTY